MAVQLTELLRHGSTSQPKWSQRSPVIPCPLLSPCRGMRPCGLSQGQLLTHLSNELRNVVGQDEAHAMPWRGPSRPRLGKSCCFWGLEWSFRNNKNGFNQQKLGFNDEEKGVYMILPAKCGKKPSTYRGLFNESWCCGSEMRYTASHKMLWKPKANIAIGDR